MIPAPTQPPPTRVAPPPATPEEQAQTAPAKVALTPARRRAGQSPVALAIKAVLRPIFKLLYYVIRWIRSHKLATLLAILLILASVFATNYLFAGQTPLGASSSSTVQQSVQNNAQISPDVQNWLLALRSGDLNTMLSIQKSMSASTRPPDSALYVLQFSEKYAQVKWTGITVTSINKAPDGMLDMFIEVDMSSTSTSTSTTTGTSNSIVLWHFTTTPTGQIFLIDYVSGRTA
ncbi:hypothetical protein [Dictyobacter kobayashii]|uniref:Uncharacterized protein n=1 Tax=Dictyobacter kobayashii TaxID=2014872 RepID=A0A402AGL6_9CHLR|nr:hypothetical protein [Dictyobacter kobayashii]GCE18247.1 hypothetical protein KDK_20470 [Dictyobacter kobayashii]